MCDYSLYEFPNRLAREGEELVTYRFPLGSLGLVSPAEIQHAQEPSPGKGFWGPVRSRFERSGWASDRSAVCAVCVPPGARLILKDIPAHLQKSFGVGAEEGGKFIETTAEPYRHRDAIQLTNGSLIPLQHLGEGQRVEILSLAEADEFVEEPQAVLLVR